MDRETIATFVERIRRAPLDILIRLPFEIDGRLPHQLLSHLNDEDKLDALRACLIVFVVGESIRQGQHTLSTMDRATITTFVDGIRRVPLDILNRLSLNFKIGDRLPHQLLSRLNDEDKLDALRACLIVFVVTDGRIVPRTFQLEASLATLRRRDSVIIAGTGSGKTLCLLIPILLCPESISITVSPLKRLQTTQVLESAKRYGIRTIAINEDTPSDPELWKSIQGGHFQHLIVSPEQLGPYKGHLPRLARLLRENRTFIQKIDRVYVDEAHNIHTAGLSHYGEDAFRPAYGKLGLLRVLLSNGTPVQVLSATLPAHILATVKERLAMSSNHLELRLGTNRPNITYATLPIVGSLRNLANLRFLIPPAFHPPMAVPKTLVFHDSKQEVIDAASFIEANLLPCLRNRDLVKHYHSDMSTEYLQQTFEDFSDPNGACQILHATAGAATGLDIRGVRVVIQYGICKNMAEMVQRAGRAVRDPNLTGLFLVMAEPWALEVKLDDGSMVEPDKPSAGVVKKNSSKQDRTSVASLQLVQSQDCLRGIFAEYLGDRSPEAHNFTSRWCCDRYSTSNFDLSVFFHGKLYTHRDSLHDDATNSKATKRARNQLRPVTDRQSLQIDLTTWRANTHKQDSFFPITWLLDDNDLELISKTHPSKLRSVRDLTQLLGETEEWEQEFGTQIFDIVSEFDQKATLSKARNPTTTRDHHPAKRAKGMVTFLPV